MGVLRADERTFGIGETRRFGYLGAVSSSFSLAWLATHRNRLRTLLFGGKRLSVLIVWDTKADETVDHDEIEVACLHRIVYGPEAS